jgi:aryl-alcohol dehydrogenase-like predicted oxidoreductase
MRPFGSSGRELSVLGYGAWTTGADTASTAIDEEGLTRAILAALDAGMTWIDTAEIYANGRSEELIGRIVGPRRDRVFLVTKVGPSGAGTGMRPEDLARAIRASLRRLTTDRIDLYLLHWHDPTVPLEETWGAMTRLADEGLARFVGVSNFGRELIERCLAVGPVHAVENQLSLLHPESTELLGWLAGRGIAYLAYGALAFGLLAGGITPTSRLDPSDWRGGAPARYESNYYEELFAPGRRERNEGFVRELARLAGEVGLALPVLSLRWVLEQPGVTATVVGSGRPEHIRTNAVAGDLRLQGETLARIDDLVSRHAAEGQRRGEVSSRTRSGSSRA